MVKERSQKSIFSRRQFFHKIAPLLPLTIVLRRQPSIKLPDKYPAPPFQIGDTVVDEWVDEFETKHCETGEIVGICWHPINHRWEYQINWLSGKSPDWMYPCFDEHLTCHITGAELRLEVVEKRWRGGENSTTSPPLLHHFQPLQSVRSRSRNYFIYYFPRGSARSAIGSASEVPEVRNSNTCAIISLLPTLLPEVSDFSK